MSKLNLLATYYWLSKPASYVLSVISVFSLVASRFSSRRCIRSVVAWQRATHCTRKQCSDGGSSTRIVNTSVFCYVVLSASCYTMARGNDDLLYSWKMKYMSSAIIHCGGKNVMINQQVNFLYINIIVDDALSVSTCSQIITQR